MKMKLIVLQPKDEALHLFAETRKQSLIQIMLISVSNTMIKGKMYIIDNCNVFCFKLQGSAGHERDGELGKIEKSATSRSIRARNSIGQSLRLYL